VAKLIGMKMYNCKDRVSVESESSFLSLKNGMDWREDTLKGESA